ncbi:MAG: hypothetical protein K2Q12_04010 [Rickettsiales bacterium]|nr:hypothetical protein [Rickettsiales bacterium]
MARIDPRNTEAMLAAMEREGLDVAAIGSSPVIDLSPAGDPDRMGGQQYPQGFSQGLRMAAHRVKQAKRPAALSPELDGHIHSYKEALRGASIIFAEGENTAFIIPKDHRVLEQMLALTQLQGSIHFNMTPLCQSVNISVAQGNGSSDIKSMIEVPRYFAEELCAHFSKGEHGIKRYNTSNANHALAVAEQLFITASPQRS